MSSCVGTASRSKLVTIVLVSDRAKAVLKRDKTFLAIIAIVVTGTTPATDSDEAAVTSTIVMIARNNARANPLPDHPAYPILLNFTNAFWPICE
jgi:hypothetical protein